MSRIFRFKDFTTRRDPLSEPQCWATCSGEDEEPCGAESERGTDWDDADDWMRDHMRETGHRNFKRSLVDFAELVPTEELQGAKTGVAG